MLWVDETEGRTGVSVGECWGLQEGGVFGTVKANEGGDPSDEDEESAGIDSGGDLAKELAEYGGGNEEVEGTGDILRVPGQSQQQTNKIQFKYSPPSSFPP
jgi:hypothetical protein